MLRRSILAIALLLVACVGATTEKEEVEFGTPAVEGANYRKAFGRLSGNYRSLAQQRSQALAITDEARRQAALEANDRDSANHAAELQKTDSAWLATARHFYSLGDGSFGELCKAFGTDSVTLAGRL